MTNTHSVRAALEEAHARLCSDGQAWQACERIRGALHDFDALVEQLQALQTAAQRILEAPKGTSHSQFRFWLMDALGDATPASTSEGRGEGEDA